MLYSAKLSQISKGDNIAILGAGPIGDSVLISSISMGAGRIHVTDKIDSRLDIATKLGADSVCNVDMCNAVEEIKTGEPLLLDIVYECCGKQEALDQAVELLRPGGKLMVVGIPQFDRWSFVADMARRKELSIIHVRRQNDCMQAAIDLIGSGIVDSSLLITHTFTFENSKQAFDLVRDYRDGVLKAMIKMEKS